MTYKEKLEQYKKGGLSLEERTQLKEDLEKHDAISEYLTERLEEEMEAQDHREFQEGKEPGNTEREFEAYVRKSIRRSFRRMGAAVCAVVLAAVLFVQFGLSPVVSKFYYDPNKKIQVQGTDENGEYQVCVTQMSRDLSIYSEVFLPGKMRDSVMAIPLGYGKYAVTLDQTITYRGTRKYSVGGQLTRGQLTLYEPDYLKPPYVNYFVCYGLSEDNGLTYQEQLEKQKEENCFTWYYCDLDSGKKALEALDDKKVYRAYVSFARRLDFSQMNSLLKRLTDNESFSIGDIWQGVCTSDFNSMSPLAGYRYDINQSGRLLTKEEQEKYPGLVFSDPEGNNSAPHNQEESILDSEQAMEQHFTSLLQYIIDHEDFLEMMGQASGAFLGKEGLRLNIMNCKSMIDYVKKHGLTYYGFVCLADKEEMQKMLEEEEILAIVAEEESA